MRFDRPSPGRYRALAPRNHDAWYEAFGVEEWTYKPSRCDLPELLAECTIATCALVHHRALEKVGGFDPVKFDEGCVTAVRNAAERLGYSHRNLISGAGHDACWINRVDPTAMVMCPCVDGLSHNEDEEISQEWAEQGCNVLFHAVVETAEIVS